jgi:hypothetical protein
MPKNFGQFTEDTSPESGQFVVGYDTAAADGERRFEIGKISGQIADPLSESISATGATLTSSINSVSGDLVTTGATLTSSIITTGATLTSSINSVSGDLVTTGATLTSSINSVSGEVVGIQTTGLGPETGAFTKSLTISGISVLTGITVSNSTGIVGGVDPQVQFSSGNTFKGASALTYDSSTNRVAIGGTFSPDHDLHISGSGPTDLERGVLKSNFGAQIGTGTWNTGEYLFMASGTGVFINYYTLPTSDPTNRGQIYRSGTSLHISAG